jgi:hypothetical protein
VSKPVVEVQIHAVAATSGGFAVFLGNQDKAFVIFVDQSVGAAIAMFMQGTQKERPLTHDLLANILRDRCAPQRLYRDGDCAERPDLRKLDVWDEVEDMTEALRKMQEEGSHPEESGEEEGS